MKELYYLKRFKFNTFEEYLEERQIKKFSDKCLAF